MLNGAHAGKLGLLYGENIFRLLYSAGLLFGLKAVLSDLDFSVVAFCLSIGILLNGISRLSIDTFAIKSFIKWKGESIDIVWRTLSLYRFSICAALALLICAVLVKMDKASGIALILIASQPIRTIDTFELYLRSKGIILEPVIIKLVSLLIPAAGVFTLILNKSIADINTAVALISAEWIIVGIGYLIISRRGKYCSRRNELLGNGTKGMIEAASILKASLSAHMAFLFFLLYSKIDQIYLFQVVSAADYSSYIIAARVNDTLLAVVMTMNIVIIPMLVNSHHSDAVGFILKIRRYSRFYLISAVIIILSIWSAKGLFYLYMPEGDYIESMYKSLNILSYLSLSCIFSFGFGLRSAYFSITGSPFNILLGSIVAAVFSFTFGLYLMQQYGVIGAVVSNNLSCILSVFISNYLTYSGRRFVKNLMFGGAGKVNTARE